VKPASRSESSWDAFAVPQSRRGCTLTLVNKSNTYASVTDLDDMKRNQLPLR